jgi:hypothetical protein
MEKKRSRAERHNFRPNASVGGGGGGDRRGRQQALPVTDDVNWLYTVWLGSVSRRWRRRKTRRWRWLVHLPRTSLWYRPLFLPSPFRRAMVVSWCSPLPQCRRSLPDPPGAAPLSAPVTALPCPSGGVERSAQKRIWFLLVLLSFLKQRSWSYFTFRCYEYSSPFLWSGHLNLKILCRHTNARLELTRLLWPKYA